MIVFWSAYFFIVTFCELISIFDPTLFVPYNEFIDQVLSKHSVCKYVYGALCCLIAFGYLFSMMFVCLNLIKFLAYAPVNYSSVLRYIHFFSNNPYK